MCLTGKRWALTGTARLFLINDGRLTEERPVTPLTHRHAAIPFSRPVVELTDRQIDNHVPRETHNTNTHIVLHLVWTHPHTKRKWVLVSLTFPAAEAPLSTEKLQRNRWTGQMNPWGTDESSHTCTHPQIHSFTSVYAHMSNHRGYIHGLLTLTTLTYLWYFLRFSSWLSCYLEIRNGCTSRHFYRKH